VPLIQHSWLHQTQPPQPRWTELALRAAALVHTGAGDVRNRNGAVIPLVSAAAATRPDEDGAYLLGRAEEGQTRLGRWNLLAAQPASITAYSLVFRLRRSSLAFDGQLVSWGDTATARRNVVLTTTTGLRVEARQGQYDTPRSETYALSAGVTHTWGVRVVAGVGIEVYRDGILQTPTASSGTMPASSLYRANSQPVWMGGESDYNALGGLYGYGLWFEDLGADTVRALSADIHNGLHEPLRIWVPVSAGGGSYTLTAESGAYTLAGQAAGLQAARTLAADAGSYTLMGQDVAMQRGQRLVADAGSYTLTGVAAVLATARVLAADAGAYALNGQAVGLTYTPAGSYSLTAEAGSYSLNGQTVDLTAARRLVADAGAYALTGQAVGLAKTSGYTITAAAGSYALSGQAVGFARAWLLQLDAGAYALTGRPVALTYSGAALPALTVSPMGRRLFDGRRSPRLSTATRPPRTSSSTR